MKYLDCFIPLLRDSRNGGLRSHSRSPGLGGTALNARRVVPCCGTGIIPFTGAGDKCFSQSCAFRWFIQYACGDFGQDWQDVKILYDRPANLQDGTPAQEVEIEWVWPNGPKTNTFLLATKRDSMWIWVSLYNDQGLTGDNLKKIAYSLKVQQGKQEPVKLPADVQAFIDESLKDLIGGDLEKIMSHVSDRNLNNGMKKAGLKQFYLYSPYSPLKVGIESGKTTITIFEPQGNKAYLTGFPAGKLKSGAPWPETPLGDRQIIKENGQWKWYGNQKQ